MPHDLLSIVKLQNPHMKGPALNHITGLGVNQVVSCQLPGMSHT